MRCANVRPVLTAGTGHISRKMCQKTRGAISMSIRVLANEKPMIFFPTVPMAWLEETRMAGIFSAGKAA